MKQQFRPLLFSTEENTMYFFAIPAAFGVGERKRTAVFCTGGVF
jgi:hypothetical protein